MLPGDTTTRWPCSNSPASLACRLLEHSSARTPLLGYGPILVTQLQVTVHAAKRLEGRGIGDTARDQASDQDVGNQDTEEYQARIQDVGDQDTGEDWARDQDTGEDQA